MEQVRAAFDIVNQCRRLPVMLETFLGECPHVFKLLSQLNLRSIEDIRKNQYLIIREVEQYMLEYEVFITRRSLSSCTNFAKDNLWSAGRCPSCVSCSRMVQSLGSNSRVRYFFLLPLVPFWVHSAQPRLYDFLRLYLNFPNPPILCSPTFIRARL
jgi:hypothetical protein